MFHKSEISFVTLWVLNPIVILFYQNCAMLPNTHARAEARANAAQYRTLASTAAPIADAPEIRTERELACESKDCLKFE